MYVSTRNKAKPEENVAISKRVERAKLLSPSQIGLFFWMKVIGLRAGDAYGSNLKHVKFKELGSCNRTMKRGTWLVTNRK
jgi:hypothetical protein